MAKTDVKVKIKPDLRLAEPRNYKVIYHNDDVTTMEFVVGSLVVHFNHNAESALEITTRIHQEGSAVVAVLPHELAEQKGIEVRLDAHSKGFPLTVKIESE
jgi:ATP-dependent Clp protease adaptor protein ClpS